MATTLKFISILSNQGTCIIFYEININEDVALKTSLPVPWYQICNVGNNYLYFHMPGIKKIHKCRLLILTPFFVRPDWEKCADVVSGGVVRWKELSDGKTSNDLVDVLLSEIQAGGPVDSGGAEYFDGQVLYILF